MSIRNLVKVRRFFYHINILTSFVYCFDIRKKREFCRLAYFCIPALYELVIKPLSKYIMKIASNSWGIIPHIFIFSVPFVNLSQYLIDRPQLL